MRNQFFKSTLWNYVTIESKVTRGCCAEERMTQPTFRNSQRKLPSTVWLQPSIPLFSYLLTSLTGSLVDLAAIECCRFGLTPVLAEPLTWVTVKPLFQEQQSTSEPGAWLHWRSSAETLRESAVSLCSPAAADPELRFNPPVPWMRTDCCLHETRLQRPVSPVELTLWMLGKYKWILVLSDGYLF